MADATANWKNLVDHASISDVGLRRANNQDSLAVALAGDESTWLTRGHLFMVADGMGAHAAGELASKMACNSIPHMYQKLADLPAPDALKQAIVEANDQIHQRGQASADFNGMGTTASTLVLLPQGAVVGHVGDSRVYRWRKSVLQQLTFDHSLVWEMKAAGHFSGGEAPPFVPKNIITRSLGPHPSVTVDLEGPFPIEQGDIFLLCSDGLSGQVSDQEIGLIMGALKPQEAVRALVDLTNLRGGPDNVTVVISRVTAPIANSQNPAETTFSVYRKEKPAVHPAVWVTIGASLILAGLLWLLNAPLLSLGCLIAAVLAALVATFQRSAATETENVAMTGTLGHGPHATVSCTPTAESIQIIVDVLNKLREAAQEESWQVNWQEFNNFCQRAEAAKQSQNFGLALREYCLAISYMVEEVRRHRGKKNKDSSVLD